MQITTEDRSDLHDLDVPKLVFVTYEVPWFPCGGIAAVMGRLPAATAARREFPVIVIAPYHGNAERIAALTPELVGACTLRLPAAPQGIAVTVHRHRAADNVWWYFLRADQPFAGRTLFAGKRHPYDLPAADLHQDAVLFGRAAVESLPLVARDLRLGQTGWKLILQDWQAATCALAFAGQAASSGDLFLTLHNTYDAYVPEAELASLGIDTGACPGSTVLDRAWPLIKRPAFTVSEQFAQELTEDTLQREVLAPHLQRHFNADRVAGIDNGPFALPALPDQVLRALLAGDYAPVSQWKQAAMRQALEQLHKPLPDVVTLWGDRQAFCAQDGAWIVMAGRDDPRQKGYDVAAAAVDEYLSRHGAGCRFLFFPIPGDEGTAGLRFLQRLADGHPGRVLVFIGRWESGFAAALRGALYGLMPSCYEPFGMANQFYLDGACPGIGRATGGNIPQIVPLRAAAAFSDAVRHRAARFHPMSARPTGILYRERDDISGAAQDWAAINTAGHGPDSDRVTERRRYPLFNAMARELSIAIDDALTLHATAPEQYYEMLRDGIVHIRNNFSWRRAAHEYMRRCGLIHG